MSRKKKGEPLSDAKPRSTAPPGCLVPFFAIFLAVGLLAGKFVFLDPLVDVLRARTWVPAPCVVLSSEVKRHDGGDSDTFSVAIRFRYSYEGATYESDRYHFERGSSSGYDGKKEIVDRHPVGSETSCWVNPNRPSEAVIDRGVGSWAWFALFPFPFVAVGAGGIWWVIWSRGREKRARKQEETGSRGGSSPLASPGAGAVAGPVSLKPRQGPVSRVAGTGCVALFWNGIVGIFVGFAVKLWMDGQGSWPLTLFLVPFVLVGLALLWAFLKTLRALGAPRPVLTLEPAAIPVGGNARLSWAFRGRAPSVSVLQVTLEGSEEATYSRGTDRVTDRALFHRSDVVLTLDPAEAATGSATVTPPPGAVPSFAAASNRVVWLLRFTAQIHGSEDVKEEYEVSVVAPEAGTGRPGR